MSPFSGVINPVCIYGTRFAAINLRKNEFWRLSGQVDPSVEKWRMQIFGDP